MPIERIVPVQKIIKARPHNKGKAPDEIYGFATHTV